VTTVTELLDNGTRDLPLTITTLPAVLGATRLLPELLLLVATGDRPLLREAAMLPVHVPLVLAVLRLGVQANKASPTRTATPVAAEDTMMP
jgi:hypothetical protein